MSWLIARKWALWSLALQTVSRLPQVVKRRKKRRDAAVDELRSAVDTLIAILNDLPLPDHRP